MNHATFVTKDSYRICFLVNRIGLSSIIQEYLQGIDRNDVLILDLYKDPSKKKTAVKDMKEYLKDIKEVLKDFNVEYVCVCNSEYYKVFAKTTKAEPYLGYVTQVEDWKILYVPDYGSIFYDPSKTRDKIQRSLQALKDNLNGIYKAPGSIQFTAHYPNMQQEIYEALQAYMNEPVLTCDIETFSLKPHLAGIASISFAKNQKEGMSFLVDLSRDEKNYAVRNLLKAFFQQYQGKLIFHNIAFDATVLIYQLFMDDIADNQGLLNGLQIMLKNFEDTKLIAYLATNSCAGNELSLKSLAQEFAGNYALDEIEDVSAVAKDTLLEYNLVDTLSTWFVYNKYRPIMVKDSQEDIYKKIFLPATVDIVQMQLTGFPLNMRRVLEVEQILQKEMNDALAPLKKSHLIEQFVHTLKEEWAAEKNQKLKKKRVTADEAPVDFNPRSHVQLQRFFYDILKLPILNKTESGLPSTDAETLEVLKNHTSDTEILEILQSLVNFIAVDKILTAFIPAFKEAPYSKKDDWHYLIGNFNLGGTVSGRLSSSKPNLQQLPATGTKYAKIIKSCFQAPNGWLLCGLDFNALEDHISALTTKDKNKLKVYIDHFDGHCLRAYSYWKSLMPDITEALEKEPEKEVEIINSIKSKHKDLRQRSKGCTFALTYAGTYRTLMKNFGFSEEEARHIEKQYHELYKESDEWVQNQLSQASKDGYVTCAFGLKVRTPLLKQVIRGTAKTPHEAEAEGRTAGNALGQSWGLLNTRAGIEFNSEVRNSEFKLNIRPCAQIHDAQYFLIKDDADTLLWANEHLVEAVSWQDDPAIYHPIVKLGGEFSIFFPDWAHECVIPNDVKTIEELSSIIEKYLESLSQH